MKIKLTSLLLFIIITFSCKNQNNESDPNIENQTQKSIIKTHSQDTLKIDSTLINSSTNDLTKNKKLLLDFYTKYGKKPQSFLIDNNKDTTIICYEKTRIKIKANSFISSKTNKVINDKIKISVKEYYKISDILLDKLSTTSNGNLLETGGMINISVTSNQEKCKLKNGETIEIEFPRKVEKEGMQLYRGNWINNALNWELIKNSIELNQTFSNIDEMPIFPGGVYKMKQFISMNTIIPEDNTISGKVFVTFIVNKDGNITDAKIKRGLSKSMNNEILRVIGKLPKFMPGKVNGIAVNVLYSLPITIESLEGENSNYKQEFENQYDNKTLKDAGAYLINSYLFSSSELGLINCDRLWKDTTSAKIDYAINLNTNSETSINIVFHRFKSIINKLSQESTISFNNIPSGENITIFAVKYFDNKPFLAIKESKTSSKSENNLVFKAVTIEMLKNEMNKLNTLN